MKRIYPLIRMICVVMTVLFVLGSISLSSADMPNLIVSYSNTEPEKINAGDSFELNISVFNTSKKQYIKNMVVRVETDGNQLRILDDSNMLYIDRIEKESSKDLVYKLKAERNLSYGSYPVTLTFSYESPDGMQVNMADTVMVYVSPDYRVELEVDDVTDKVESGSVYLLPINVTNYSGDRIYNAEVSLEVDGLKSLRSLYIGNMDGGSQFSLEAQVFATYLSGDPGQFGYTQGTVRLTYETAEGDKKNVEQPYSVTIEKPFVPEEKEIQKKKVDLTPFIIAGEILLAVAIVILIVIIRRYRKIEK